MLPAGSRDNSISPRCCCQFEFILPDILELVWSIGPCEVYIFSMYLNVSTWMFDETIERSLRIRSTIV